MSHSVAVGGIAASDRGTMNIGQEATMQAGGALHFGKNDG